MKISTVERPWGLFEQFTHNENSTVKILYVNKGEEFSLQVHSHRDEFWKVISGNPLITIGDDKIEAKIGDEFNAPAGTKHRISAPVNDVAVLEIATGDFDEHDEIRLEDKYSRV